MWRQGVHPCMHSAGIMHACPGVAVQPGTQHTTPTLFFVAELAPQVVIEKIWATIKDVSACVNMCARAVCHHVLTHAALLLPRVVFSHSFSAPPLPPLHALTPKSSNIPAPHASSHLLHHLSAQFHSFQTGRLGAAEVRAPYTPSLQPHLTHQLSRAPLTHCACSQLSHSLPMPPRRAG